MRVCIKLTSIPWVYLYARLCQRPSEERRLNIGFGEARHHYFNTLLRTVPHSPAHHVLRLSSLRDTVRDHKPCCSHLQYAG